MHIDNDIKVTHNDAFYLKGLFDIKHRIGRKIFDADGRLSAENYPYAIEPDTYLAIMVDMQEQINDLVAEVKELKQDGWSRK